MPLEAEIEERLDVACVQFNDYLYDKQEGEQLHYPRPIDERRFDVMVKFFSHHQRQQAATSQDAPCGASREERHNITHVHAREDGRKELASRLDIWRTENGPTASDEAEGKEARQANCQPVIWNMSEKWLADFMYYES